MKKKLVTVILAVAMSASLLAGCGTKAEPVVSESVEETAETSEGTAEECAHEWVDATCQEPKHCSKCGETEGTPLDHVWAEATFAAPKTCTLCGETEGERTQSYFEEHGAEVPDAPVSCTVDGVIYNRDNPETYQKVADSVWEQTGYNTEPAEEEGYQLVHLELHRTMPLYYDVQKDVWYTSTDWSAGVYDWYTGRMLPVRDMKDDDAFAFATTLEIDGARYDVSYTVDVQWEQDDWVYDETGNGSSVFKGIFSYVFKVPEGYDGLVYGAIPMREHMEIDTETVKGEEAEYATLDETDEDYTEGIKFFRINRSDDSAIMTGANAASGTVAGGISDGAVVDDSRAQGSIGESGLPYYKVGFSPKDFTIGGFSVYDGKTVDEMFDAVDIPDFADTNGSVEGYYRQSGANTNGKTMFGQTVGHRSCLLVYYTDDAEQTEIYFTSYDDVEASIAEADFIQSPIIPGETTFAGAVDALGIRDIVTAMGIQGDAFEDAFLEFESQFGENSECHIIWHDDVHNLVMDWIDRDGREVNLTLIGTDDMVDSMIISIEN